MQTLPQISRATLRLVATAAIALASAAAMSSEATEFSIEPSLKTRAEVIAEIANWPKETGFVQVGEASVFIDTMADSHRSRDEIRAEARQAVRDHHFEVIYAGG